MQRHAVLVWGWFGCVAYAFLQSFVAAILSEDVYMQYLFVGQLISKSHLTRRLLVGSEDVSIYKASNTTPHSRAIHGAAGISLAQAHA